MSADLPVASGGAVERRQNGTFAAGVSGNPTGRPKAEREVLDLARENAPDAIRELARIVRDGKSERCRILAAQVLLDRAYGRPSVSIAGDDARAFVGAFAALVAADG